MLELSNTHPEIPSCKFEQPYFPRFLDLPFELRCMIYRYCIDDWTITVAYSEHTDRFILTGLPDYALLLVCKLFQNECCPIMRRAFTCKIRLKDVRVHRKGKFGFQSSLEVVATMGIDHLLSRVHTVTIDNGTTGMLALLPWYKFPKLHRVELEDCLKANPFAVGKISQFWPFDSIRDTDGRCQICGIFGYDEWTCVPTEVAQGNVKVVSVRKGFASGACVKATVEYKKDCGQFVDRVCEDEMGGWRWMMNQAGSL